MMKIFELSYSVLLCYVLSDFIPQANNYDNIKPENFLGLVLGPSVGPAAVPVPAISGPVNWSGS